MLTFGILTVSTTCFHQPDKDQAGPKLEEEIKRAFPDCQITFKHIVSDNREDIVTILEQVTTLQKCDVLFTVGGTGFAPSDVTPEATKLVIEKEAPGLAYALISKSLAVTDMAMLSRPVCGIKRKTIILNFPGSTKAATECFGFVKEAIPHAAALVKNEIEKVKMDHQIIQQSSDLDSPSTKSKVKIVAGASRARQSPYPMLEVPEALKIIRENVPKLSETENISIEHALTRILAEDIKAPNPIPAFPASIKDGYAVRSSDGPGERRVQAVVAAGDALNLKELERGEIVRISTGAALPPGADAVVQVEDTTLVKASANGEDEEIVLISVAAQAGQDIRQVGSDIEANALVLKKYSLITSAYVGVLAMLGIPEVKVFKRPSIGVISTGNELVSFKEPLKQGHIYDSNKITLLTLLRTYGYQAVDCGIARDRPNSVKAVLENAFAANDLIISSGGVSMGEYDLLKQVLVDDFHAQVHVGRLNMKPGKPTVFATLSFKGKAKAIFALPGNPVSCCVTTLLFVIPTIKYVEQDLTFSGWPTVDVKLEHDIINKDQRPEYVRMKVVTSTTKQLTASSTGNQISSRLNSMVDANGLLLIAGKTHLKKGETVTVYLFGLLLGHG